jgi:hypothetical protein
MGIEVRLIYIYILNKYFNAREMFCFQFVLETPPISPPQLSDGSPPSSPYPHGTAANRSQDSVVMMSPIKIVPMSKNGK